MKSVFARHGIPSKVRSDSGSQCVSAEFRQFAESWGFTHPVSSPHYQQSNGLAERFVQSVKKMLSKSKQDGKDPYIAMLKYRNTPLGNLDSPARLLMNRRLRTTIPTIKNRLKPKCGNLKNTQRQKMKQQKMNQKQYYDNKHNPKRKWDKGTLVRNNNTPKSYVIETPEGQIFKRNRKHLLKTKEDKIEQTSLEESNENNHNDFDNITDEQSLEPSFVRRIEDRYLNSTTYNGKVSCTVNGTPCVFWNLQKDSRLPINSDDHVTNYCRDPDGIGQPRCYVDHQRYLKSWKFCYVPKR
ncbi:unnamed protein product [Mytilus coruscus]|uniref:Integrase catalytic domain-containing protein n=1 Tax=Mytilus coruscus TaxID=42192 RepID=A0A6J8ADU7_MYTCO|nr:unnamed protein product [Mytilus coruscus]